MRVRATDLLHQLPGLVEVAHPGQDVEGFLEGVGGWVEVGALERELEELVGFEAVGVGGKEAAEHVFDERRGEERRGDVVGESGVEWVVWEWVVVDDFDDFFDLGLWF